MRLAISVEDNNGLESNISHHFGRCPYFVLVDVEGEEIGEVQVIDNPYYAQHQPGMVPEFIHNHNADVMISGGMGRRAIAFFQEYGIDINVAITEAAKDWGASRADVDDFVCWYEHIRHDEFLHSVSLWTMGNNDTWPLANLDDYVVPIAQGVQPVPVQ